MLSVLLFSNIISIIVIIISYSVVFLNQDKRKEIHKGKRRKVGKEEKKGTKKRRKEERKEAAEDK